MTGIDLAPLGAALESRFGKPNIEGALVLGEELVLLQRGNKGDRRNARIRLRLDHVIQSMVAERAIGIGSRVQIEEVDLGLVGGVPLCFSDGWRCTGWPHGLRRYRRGHRRQPTGTAPAAAAALGILGKGGCIDLLEPIDARYKVEGIEAGSKETRSGCSS